MKNYNFFIAALLLVVSLTLWACYSNTSALVPYVDLADGYQFLYPRGWERVEVRNASEGVDVVYRDLVERTENLSVIISTIPENQTLTNLGSSIDVGYGFLQKINANPQIKAELISTGSRKENNHVYYIFEYEVQLPSGVRHDLATATVSKGKLFTFNLSTPQKRWKTVKDLFRIIVNSFSVAV